jgi:hypothetical protein
MRIGPGSPIAKLWGIFPVSYPCLMGNPYDRVVSEVYPRVVKTGEPHYGHVYAAMSLPDRQVRWMPYQRVVLPHRFPDGRMGVTVISEVSPVDIQDRLITTSLIRRSSESRSATDSHSDWQAPPGWNCQRMKPRS